MAVNSFYSRGVLLLGSAGVSLTQLAKLLDVSPSTISRWVDGVVRPRSDFISVVRAVAGDDIARQLEELVKS